MLWALRSRMKINGRVDGPGRTQYAIAVPSSDEV
jgi:hypothetical protein